MNRLTLITQAILIVLLGALGMAAWDGVKLVRKAIHNHHAIVVMIKQSQHAPGVNPVAIPPDQLVW